MTAPDADEFEIWAESPITRWVMAGVQRFADLQKVHWAESSWASGIAEQAALDRMKVRADAYEGFAMLTYEQAVGLHEDEDPA